MDIIFYCLDEIALEGLDGITLDSLWIRLQFRQSELNLDDNYRSYIWKSIILNCGELEFFELPVSRPCIILKIDSKEEDHIDKIYPIDMINDDKNMIHGSCSTYNNRTNVTKIIKNDGLSLTQVTQRWGDRMCIVASQSRREKALMGESRQATLAHSFFYLQTYCILEYVGRSRHEGATSHNICKLFKISQANIFNIFKKFKDIITVQNYYGNQYNLLRFPSTSIDATCFKKFIEILVEKGDCGMNKSSLLAETKLLMNINSHRIRNCFYKFSKEFIIEKQVIKNDETGKSITLEIVKLGGSASVDAEDYSSLTKICKDRKLMSIDDSLARNIKNYICANQDKGRSNFEICHLLGQTYHDSLKNNFHNFNCFDTRLHNNNAKLETRNYWKPDHINTPNHRASVIPVTEIVNEDKDCVLEKNIDDALKEKLLSFIKDKKLNPLQLSRVDIVYDEFVQRKCITTLSELMHAIHRVEKTQCCDHKTCRRVLNYFVDSGVVKRTSTLVDCRSQSKMVEFLHICTIDEQHASFLEAIDCVKKVLMIKGNNLLEKEKRQIKFQQLKEKRELKLQAKKKKVPTATLR